MQKIELLKPKVKKLAGKLIGKSLKNGIKISIYQTYRTIEEQNKLYAKGRTEPGSIVTKAKGGYSMHNYGVAFDCAPLSNNGGIDWGNIELFKKVGRIGESIGLEWGGSWISFPDYPHFQYTAGYKLKDFINNKIDLSKFDDNMISELAERLKGRILLQAESHHEAWYVNPLDGKRYYLKDSEEALRIMKKFGLGITNSDLEKIKIGKIE